MKGCFEKILKGLKLTGVIFMKPQHMANAFLLLGAVILVATGVISMDAEKMVGPSILFGTIILFYNIIFPRAWFTHLNPFLKIIITALISSAFFLLADYLVAYFQLTSPYTFANKVGFVLGILGVYFLNCWIERSKQK